LLRYVSFGLFALTLVSGCARDRYHRAADRDTLRVVSEKTGDRPWKLPGQFAIDVDPSSRLHDASDPVDPTLPEPGTDLYSYKMGPVRAERLPTTEATAPAAAGIGDGWSARSKESLPSHRVQLVSHVADPEPPAAKSYAETHVGLTIQSIPKSYWEAIPPVCLSRMLEFASVRQEYRRTYQVDAPESLRDQAVRLAFADIVTLARLNSREYQSQKESLYSSALSLTRERYNYMTKFSSGGNTVSLDYDHVRTDGATSQTLSFPSTLAADRMVALGGTAVARFANSVVLTLDGPQGFAKDISSNLLFEFSQSVFQRDVLLEPLIQSERNVVYAARRYTRYRKQFYFNLAQTYYQDLLSTYRSIEINTQNYFGVVRALDQAEAEVRSGVNSAQPRFQIDQIEQNMLSGRRGLINSCNSLETSLDRLKLTLGLPTETPINIDLSELESLTLRDEIEVSGELVRRARDRLVDQLASPRLDREDIVSTNLVLLDRILIWVDLRQRIGQQEVEAQPLRSLRAALRVDERYVSVDRTQQRLDEIRRAVPPAAPITVFRGTSNSIEARLQLTARQLQLFDESVAKGPGRDTVLAAYETRKTSTEALLERMTSLLRGESKETVDVLQSEADATLKALVDLEPMARRMVGSPAQRSDARVELGQSADHAKNLLVRLETLVGDNQAGLPGIEMSVDDAMVTALVQRFELMNERGSLADDWRAIKLAADDLKSVLNLNVRHSLASRDNRALNFSVQDSQTELRAAVDLPLNRRSQRNSFRQALINYQSGRRSLMSLEDDVKFAARQDLRQLSLDRVQYDISVISAALASERVFSTQLELSLGLATVTARDFLESQRDYRVNLSSVATGRLGYIVNRARLALDLELMVLNGDGMWGELNAEGHQLVPNREYPPEAGSTYGDLPEGIWPSKAIKRMGQAQLPGADRD
jgi:hypothetical protein